MEKTEFWLLEEEALARPVQRTRFGRCYVPALIRRDDDDDDDDDVKRVSYVIRNKQEWCKLRTIYWWENLRTRNCLEAGNFDMVPLWREWENLDSINQAQDRER